MRKVNKIQENRPLKINFQKFFISYLNSWPRNRKRDNYLHSSSGIIRKIKMKLRRFGEIKSDEKLRIVINKIGEDFQARLPKEGKNFTQKLRVQKHFCSCLMSFGFVSLPLILSI